MKMAAASSLHVNVETTEAWTTVSHFSDGPKTSNQLTRPPLPRRQNAFRVGALVAVLFVLTLLSAMITCSQVFKKRVARRHESMGRRLAAGGEEEEEEAFLSQVFRECVGWRRKVGDTAVGDTKPEDTPTRFQGIQHPGSAGIFYEESHAVPKTHTHVSQASISLLPRGSVPGGLPSLVDAHFTPQDQPHFSPSERLDFASTRLPHRLPPIRPFVPGEWGGFREPSTGVSTLHRPKPPSPLKTRAREKRGPSPLTFHDSTESKRQKVRSTRSPEGFSRAFAGFSSLQQSTATAEQHHQQSWHEEAANTFRQSAMSPSAWVHFPVHVTPMTAQHHQQSWPFSSVSIAPSTVGHGAWIYPPVYAFPISEQYYQQPWPYPADSMMPPAMSHSAHVRLPAQAIPAYLPELSLVSSHRSQQPAPTAPAASSLVTSLTSSASVSRAEASFPLPPPAPPMPPNTHLYYRLPVVQPEDILTVFDITKAFRPGFRKCPAEFFVTIHRLLTRPSITRLEAEELVLACEKLASHLRGHHTAPLSFKRPCFAAFSLARRYLFVEAMFCSIQVLGPAMRAESWWPQLIQSIPTVFVAPATRRECPGTLMAQRLSSALALLKNGIRPSLEDTVKLKRDLFTGRSVKLGFNKKVWDEWRRDDESDPGPLG